MALQFGNTKIGEMQYNGVTIGEAMIDGQVVYRSGPEPATGTWGPEPGYWQVIASHTITQDGTYTITNTATGLRTGSALIFTPHGTTSGPYGDPSIAETTETLTAGDVVEFSADGGGFGSPMSGTWTITPTATQREPQTWTFTTVGSHTITLPEWASYVDIVCIGGGGAGGNGGGAVANAGEGGKAGTFGTASLEVRDLSSMQLTAEVGGGGTRGSGGGAVGGSGSNSRVVYAGTTNRVGDPGQGGAGGRGALGNASLADGRSAASITYKGIHYSGGSGGAYRDSSTGGGGNSPGGGGGGGGGGVLGAHWNGGNGGNGAVWITARA